jgi:hypothetical protein
VSTDNTNFRRRILQSTHRCLCFIKARENVVKLRLGANEILPIECEECIPTDCVLDPNRNNSRYPHKKGKLERKIYRETFRFSDSDRLEKHVHKLYDLATNYGVHGHQTTYLTSEPKGATPDNNALFMDVSDIAVYRILEIWLASFFPLQELCFQTFRTARGVFTLEAETHYYEVRKGFEEALKDFRKSLRQMRADAIASLH